MTNNTTTNSSFSLGKNNMFGWALWSMLLFAAIYEPVRQILVHVQTSIEVGGVGGVGGLANLGPATEACSKRYGNEYCYVNGDVGPFMMFAILTLVAWVGPLLVASLVIAVAESSSSNSSRKSSCTTTTNTTFLDESSNTIIDSTTAAATTTTTATSPQLLITNATTTTTNDWLVPLWIGLNILWFIVPWTTFAFGLSDTDGSNFTKQILALSLAASHPLSWNLSLVVIPTGGIITKCILLLAANKNNDDNNNVDNNNTQHDTNDITMMKAIWFPSHRLLGYATAFWAMLHGLGELIWIVSSKERFLNRIVRIDSNGENLLYWAGILTFGILLLHSYVAYYRRRRRNNNEGNDNDNDDTSTTGSHTASSSSFRVRHRFLATLLLLAAAMHWWPFALLFVPATAVHGVNMAQQQQQQHVQEQQPPFSVRIIAWQLVAALMASLGGLTMVWSFRQAYMQGPHANLYVPFVFPPLSVMVSTIAAYLAVRLLMMMITRSLFTNSTSTDEEVVEAEDDGSSRDPNHNDTMQTPLLLVQGLEAEEVI